MAFTGFCFRWLDMGGDWLISRRGAYGNIFPPTLNDAVDVLSSPRSWSGAGSSGYNAFRLHGNARCVETHWFGLGEEPAKSDWSLFRQEIEGKIFRFGAEWSCCCRCCFCCCWIGANVFLTAGFQTVWKHEQHKAKIKRGKQGWPDGSARWHWTQLHLFLLASSSWNPAKLIKCPPRSLFLFLWSKRKIFLACIGRFSFWILLGRLELLCGENHRSVDVIHHCTTSRWILVEQTQQPLWWPIPKLRVD